MNVRLITATSMNLVQAIQDGTFKQDLYFRLAVIEIRLPPLRSRTADIPALAAAFLDRLNEEYRDLLPPKRFSQKAMTCLVNHHWPGNVRELLNVVKASYFNATAEVIRDSELLFSEFSRQAGTRASLPDPCHGFKMEAYLSQVRSSLIQKALEKAAGRPTAAARLLGCSAENISRFQRARRSPAD